MLLGGWMLQHFLAALCWAVALAIGTSKLYDRWLRNFNGKHREVWAALTFTLIVGLVLIVPLVYGGIVAVREAQSLWRTLLDKSKGPPQLPDWLQHLPYVGEWRKGVRLDTLSAVATHGDKAAEHATTTGAPVQARPGMYQWQLTRLVGIQLLRRLSTLVFTLLMLFFVFLFCVLFVRGVLCVGWRLFG